MKHWIKLLSISLLAITLASCATGTRPQTGSGPSMDDEETIGGIPVPDDKEGPRPNIPGDIEWGKWENVHFDYDSATIRPEGRKILETVASWMKENAGKKIIISGHCDERGTLEYNRALGQRRASAARAYLIKLGAPKNDVSTVSHGEEQPLDKEHNDGAWAKNRRAEFGIIQ